MPDPEFGNGSIETLLPRLGEYLIQAKLITPEQLEEAITIQKENQVQGNKILLGKVLVDQGAVDPVVLDQAITQQIFDLHEALRNSNIQLEQRVFDRTSDLEKRLLHIRTAAEITQTGLGTNDLHFLLNEVVRLVVERFGYYSASIFLVDEEKTNLILVAAAGPFSTAMLEKGQVIPIGHPSMVGWVAQNNVLKLAPDVKTEFNYRIDDLLTETVSEVSIPITPVSPTARDQYKYQSTPGAGEEVNPERRVLGVLDVQADQSDAFDADVISVLQTIANHLASWIENLILLNLAETRLSETTMLFNASQSLSKANNKADVETVIIKILEASQQPALLLANYGSEFRLLTFFNLKNHNQRDGLENTLERPLHLVIEVSQVETIFINQPDHLFVDMQHPTTYPQPVVQIMTQTRMEQAVFLPVRLDERIEMVIITGAQEEQLSSKNEKDDFYLFNIGSGKRKIETPFIQAYISLAQLFSNALDRVTEFGSAERRIGALQALNSISQLVSEGTNLKDLYHKIHIEITKYMGDIDFFIAIYENEAGVIQIPYMIEVDPVSKLGKPIHMDPFPLGRGLTSSIIQTRQPLMINFDAVNKARQSGAIIVGRPAKSWLGVPLLISGEPIGAIVVQDRYSEGRFKSVDQRLLVTMAAQVATSIHNAKLLEKTTRQAQRERMLLETTAKIRNSSDLEAILSTTADELRKILNVRKARLEIDVDAALPVETGMQPSTTISDKDEV